VGQTSPLRRVFRPYNPSVIRVARIAVLSMLPRSASIGLEAHLLFGGQLRCRVWRLEKSAAVVQPRGAVSVGPRGARVCARADLRGSPRWWFCSGGLWAVSWIRGAGPASVRMW